MNVALVTKSISRLAGGVVEAMRPYARLLSNRFDIDVEALGIEDRYSRSDADLWASVTGITFKCIGPHSIGYSPDLDRYLSATSFDLVHTHGLFYYTSAAVAKWSGRHNRPYVISPHGMLDDWALGNSRLKKRLFSFLCEDNHLGRARCVHALCDAEVRSVRKYGLKNPVCCIPNGVDMPRAVPIHAPPWDEKAVGGKKVLLYLGRIHPKKGLPDLLDAWARVQGQGREAEDWALVIVGWDQDGHEDSLKKYVAEKKLEDAVFFPGSQFNEAKTACYRNADAFILPSLSEGLPMVVLEAWSHKLPVLMTPACNLQEGFEAGAAVQVQPETDDMVLQLRSFFALSDMERKEMGQRGYELVAEKFTWDRVAEDMYEVYQWVLGGGTPPSCVITD